MAEIIILGTGNAMVTKIYNTCFAIRNEKEIFLCDAGGGNGILSQAQKAGMEWEDVHSMFITHAHTDHIIGVIWVLRMINEMIKKGSYEGCFTIYGAKENLDFVRESCKFLLKGELSGSIIFIPVEDGSEFEAANMKFKVFDIYSTKKYQLGFTALLSGKKIVCLGDEPFNEKCISYAENADYLLSEAFCLYEDRERFKPYEKHHSTAWDAGIMAAKLNAKNLILYHTEDKTIDTRKERYTKEAKKEFSGEVFVPYDLEKIEIL